jgi:hypothetical protein
MTEIERERIPADLLKPTGVVINGTEMEFDEIVFNMGYDSCMETVLKFFDRYFMNQGEINIGNWGYKEDDYGECIREKLIRTLKR